MFLSVIIAVIGFFVFSQSLFFIASNKSLLKQNDPRWFHKTLWNDATCISKVFESGVMQTITAMDENIWPDVSADGEGDVDDREVG